MTGADPFASEAGAKRYRRGTHRIRDPEATLAWLRPLLPAMGVTRLANLTGLDRVGIPVVAAYRPNARSLSVFQGKGLDLAAAKVSAAMEAVEAYHAEHVLQPLLLASADEMRPSRPLIDLAGLPPAPGGWDPGRQILWIEGRCLRSGAPLWLPYETVHLNHTLPLPTGSGCFASGSSGLGSGNTWSEAVLQALCELLERDATARWARLSPAERDARAIDLTTVGNPDCRELLDHFARAAVTVTAWDVTSGFGVPAFLCLVADGAPDGGGDLADPEFGAGCHPSPAVALARALAEAAQVRATVIAGARDDIPPDAYTPASRARRRRKAAAVLPLGRPFRRFDVAAGWDSGTVPEDLDAVLARLGDAGIDPVAVDLTRDGLGIPVVRTVAPGLLGPEWDTPEPPGAVR
ncbi:YcaO-like family protein [Arenibaculum pallidiluteum]|uniref:YcaO-like family protein n=1 Tax=Arenibaculum pallidiluteum TaxID=2812559 RepID=UPI001A97BD5D|nr:YcaO-like family protein [Arenibaculum pallidiluteum]